MRRSRQRGEDRRRGAERLNGTTPKHVALNWAWCLKRVFGIEIKQCVRCGGRLEAIASIEEPELIERILAHRRERGGEEAMTVSLEARRRPPAALTERRYTPPLSAADGSFKESIRSFGLAY